MAHIENRSILQDIRLTPLGSKGEMVVAPAEVARAAGDRLLFLRRYGLFLWTFVLPVAAASLYLFMLASDRYVSEAQFVVRSANSSGFESTASLVQSNGLSRARDETYVVNEYIMSRDALDVLMDQGHLKSVFDSPKADFINRYPIWFSKNNKDSFFNYYKKMVSASVDSSTGISTIHFVAFTPEDSRRLTGVLLDLAEKQLNRLNERAQKDALAYANKIVANAKADLLRTEENLTAYRNKSGMVDPASEVAQALSSIGRLSTEVAQMRATADQRKALTPDAPGGGATREKIKSLRDEIARQNLKLAGGDASIAGKLSGYEALVLEREINEKALAGAMTNRGQARQSADQQHLYLQAIVQPNLPDQPAYPRRFIDLMATVIAAAAVFSILRSLREITVERAI